jgi:N-acetylglucosamine kinase-like BadF-type ATPase
VGTRYAYLGIDGGGSETIARAEDVLGAVIYERASGPTNPRTTPLAVVCERFDDLLTGSPHPDSVAVCLAGMQTSETRARIGSYFRSRYPAAALRVEPDYVAAFGCFDPAPGACVVNGTGSVVCSRDEDGTFVTSGGRGYLLGDQGSGFRLGQALVARFVDDPDSVGRFGLAICDVLGVTRPGDVVATVYGSPSPAALLGRAAPVLTEAAGELDWAHELVTREMAELADLVAAHLERHDPALRDQNLRLGIDETVVGLVGGVWTSDIATSAFEDALRDRLGTWPVAFARPNRTPAQAAVQLAREAAP